MEDGGEGGGGERCVQVATGTDITYPTTLHYPTLPGMTGACGIHPVCGLFGHFSYMCVHSNIRTLTQGTYVQMSSLCVGMTLGCM